jgi:glycerol-3-phosphate acyltransferase PlsY
LRAAGWQAGLLTATIDTLKSALAVWVARWFGAPELVMALTGAAAVVGHNYSVFIGFRGGAGTMTSIGGAMALWPWSVVVAVPSGLGVAVATRRASLGSIVVALLIPSIFVARALVGVGSWEHVIYGVLTSGLTLWSLRPNILRLLSGEERAVNLQVAEMRDLGARQGPDVVA